MSAMAAGVRGWVADVRPEERRAVLLACLGNFLLLAAYYVLRPLRDVMATVVGVDQLQQLFTGTLLLTLVCAPLFAWLTDTFRLSRVLPGLFGFWVGNILLFHVLFAQWPESRWLAAAYYWWFSVVNLFMISVFWSLMVDVFAPPQAARLFALIAAGGSSGAVAGPLLTRALIGPLGVGGMLLVAAAGFVLVIVLLQWLMREKQRLQALHVEVQASTLDHRLSGSAWDGFRVLFSSSYAMNQALFMLLMTWIATIAYFLQTDLIARDYTGIAARTVALADIDLVVNLCSAIVLIFGLGRFITRWGVTAALVASPVLMALGFVAMALSPTLRVMQAMQVLRRVSQYAIARPSREICFTVVPQASRYKAKNVIDTVAYRFGDVSAAWVQAGLRAAGFGSSGVLGLGLAASGAWAAVALALGRRYEQLRRAAGAASPDTVSIHQG
ncbi:MAG: MFS transporter [Gammaproteobacteria bacterium]|nr:MFS transporter [Gammaproteobacteria bacterium]